jgi:hypothetical protein
MRYVLMFHDPIGGRLVAFGPALSGGYISVGAALNAAAARGWPGIPSAMALFGIAECDGLARWRTTWQGVLTASEIDVLVALAGGAPFSESTAVLSLRDPDVETVAAWKRDWYRPFLSANQYAIARAVGAAFSDGFYIARMFDRSALDMLGVHEVEARFWRPSYFHLRNAIADVVDDPILCARVALELSK